MSGAFGTSLRRRAGDPRRLWQRIDAQIAERLEDAVDSACLDLMVQLRRDRDLPMPLAASARDRREFEDLVRALLERLGELQGELTPEERSRLAPVPSPTGAAASPALGLQVALAKVIPDYWARFDRIRIEFVEKRRAAAASGESKRPTSPPSL